VTGKTAERESNGLSRKRDRCIDAILTPPQLEKLCGKFGIDPGDLTANMEGWEKQVLIASDRVFLFPRSPEHVRTLKRELTVYETFSGLSLAMVPKLIGRYRDSEISFYEFGVVERLRGIPFSNIERDVNLRQLERFLSNLANTVAGWHEIPAADLASLVARVRRAASGGRVSSENWPRKALSKLAVHEAVIFIQRLIARNTAAIEINSADLVSDGTRRKWERTLKELAGLQRVLVHTDLHEDQILIESEECLDITGILDWGSVRIDNPVWDFNFGEWGFEIWGWLRNFGRLRRLMWREYLKARKIRLSTYEGLHLFFTLLEVIWLVKERKLEPVPFSGAGFADSMRMYVDRLREITSLL
jgi:aminoglycoside phosphotransferase (APT) family kinase protein